MINDIKAVEERLGLSFSDEYRDFLQIYNGGEPTKSIAMFHETAHESVGLETVDYFFGVGMEGEYTAERAYQRYGRSIPDGLLPISMGFAGHIICLAIEGPNDGQVFLQRGYEYLRVADDLVDLLGENVGKGPLQEAKLKRLVEDQ